MIDDLKVIVVMLFFEVGVVLEYIWIYCWFCDGEEIVFEEDMLFLVEMLKVDIW